MKFALIIIFCFATLSIEAQIDSEQKSTAIPAIETEEETPHIEPISSKPIENMGLSIPNENRVNGLSVPKTMNSNLSSDKKQFSMFNEEEFGDPGELYVKQIKKHTRYTEKEDEISNNGSTTNQYFGDFKTKANKVSVVYRDHQYPDGDRIRVFVNDDVVQASVVLYSNFSGFKLDLQPGFNKIDFLALNQGESGPNTAEFQILDENGYIISSNVWNLATGVKGTVILVKED